MSYLKLHSEYACFNRWLSVKQHSYFSTTRIRLKLGVKVVHTQANASRGAVSCTKQTICSCCLLCFKVQHHRVQFKMKHVIRRPFKAYPNNTGIIKKEVKPLSANETRKWWRWQLTNQNNFDYYIYILEKCKALTRPLLPEHYVEYGRKDDKSTVLHHCREHPFVLSAFNEWDSFKLYF